jgi:hypothetical protein
VFFMKRWLPLFLLPILLISCGAPSTPAPTATATLIPSATVLPTITPTATFEPTPTATLDPNAPQGTPGMDDKGPYVEVNKVKVRPYEIQSPNEKTQIWAGSLNVGEVPIPTWDQGDVYILMPNLVLVDQRVPGADTVSLYDHPAQHQPSLVEVVPQYNLRFPGWFGESRGTVKTATGHSLINAKFMFTTPLGTFEWWASSTSEAIDNGQQTITTLIRREQDMPVVKDRTNGVVKYVDPSDSDNYFLMKLYVSPTDPDHKLVCEIASHKSLDELTPLQRAMLVELGPFFVIAGEDQRNNQYWTDVYDIMNLAIDKAVPFITFSPRP